MACFCCAYSNLTNAVCWHFPCSQDYDSHYLLLVYTGSAQCNGNFKLPFPLLKVSWPSIIALCSKRKSAPSMQSTVSDSTTVNSCFAWKVPRDTVAVVCPMTSSGRPSAPTVVSMWQPVSTMPLRPTSSKVSYHTTETVAPESRKEEPDRRLTHQSFDASQTVHLTFCRLVAVYCLPRGQPPGEV